MILTNGELDYNSCDSSGQHHRCELWYSERKKKTSGTEGDICFLCATSEQTACEAGSRARKRVFASELSPTN